MNRIKSHNLHSMPFNALSSSRAQVLPLPSEILLQITQHLNSHSIISFISAFPTLKEHTILITDHERSPLFFDIPGIERRVMNNLKHPELSQLYFFNREPEAIRYQLHDPHETKQFGLKLFEFQNCNTFERSIYGYERSFNLCDFDVNTFLFIKPQTQNADPTTLTDGALSLFDMKRRLDSLTSANWHIGFQLHHDQELHFDTPFSPTNIKTAKILHLYLDYQDDLCDIEFLDSMSLTIIFRGQARRPLLKSILAPRLERFVVHYNGAVPHMEGLEGLGTPTRELYHTPNWNDPKYLRDMPMCTSVEIADIRCIEGNQMSSAVEVHPLSTEIHRETLELSFLNNFTSVSLIGIPPILLECLPVGMTCHFLFLQLSLTPQSTFTDSGERAIQLSGSQNQHKVHINVNGRNSRVPRIECLMVNFMDISPHVPKFVSTYMTILASGVDVKRFMCESNFVFQRNSKLEDERKRLDDERRAYLQDVLGFQSDRVETFEPRANHVRHPDAIPNIYYRDRDNGFKYGSGDFAVYRSTRLLRYETGNDQMCGDLGLTMKDWKKVFSKTIVQQGTVCLDGMWLPGVRIHPRKGSTFDVDKRVIPTSDFNTLILSPVLLGWPSAATIQDGDEKVADVYVDVALEDLPAPLIELQVTPHVQLSDDRGHPYTTASVTIVLYHGRMHRDNLFQCQIKLYTWDLFNRIHQIKVGVTISNAFRLLFHGRYDAFFRSLSRARTGGPCIPGPLSSPELKCEDFFVVSWLEG